MVEVSKDGLLPVTQADREAAAAIVRWQRTATEAWEAKNPDALHFFVADFSRAIVQGIWDEHPVVQAFARHRIEATATLQAERDRYRVALEQIAADRFGISSSALWEVSLERRDIARTALSDTPTVQS